MTIKLNKGNLLTSVISGVILHGCNARGSFGKGFAKQVRELYPSCYNTYRSAYHDDKLILGKIIWHKHNDNLFIANAITQEDYGNNKNKVYVDYNAIRKCFNTAFKACSTTENKLLKTIHFPLIGAGLGGGDWNLIDSIIKEELSKFDNIEANLWIL